MTSQRIIKITPLPSHVTEPEIRKLLPDFKIQHIDIVDKTAYLTIDDFTSDQQEIIEFLFPGMYHGEWNATISVDGSVEEEFERVRRENPGRWAKREEQHKVPTITEPLVDRKHQNSNLYDVTDLHELDKQPVKQPDSPPRVIYVPDEQIPPLAPKDQQIPVPSQPTAFRSSFLSSVPPPIPQIQNLVKPVVREAESLVQELFTKAQGRPIPGYIWTVIFVAYFVWMSV